jgi:hypothetical protein
MSGPIHEAIGVNADEILVEHALGENLTTDVLGALVREGVDMDAICQRVALDRIDPPRLDRVEPLDGRHFEFARYGHGDDDYVAMTFVVRDEIGDPVDVAAWTPSRPILLWLGRGALLGGEYALAPRLSEGLLVHETPLEWLRAECRGVVVLDDRRARPLLYRAQPLQVVSIEQGRELRAMLEVKPPKILVSDKWRLAA